MLRFPPFNTLGHPPHSSSSLASSTSLYRHSSEGGRCSFFSSGSWPFTTLVVVPSRRTTASLLAGITDRIAVAVDDSRSGGRWLWGCESMMPPPPPPPPPPAMRSTSTTESPGFTQNYWDPHRTVSTTDHRKTSLLLVEKEPFLETETSPTCGPAAFYCNFYYFHYYPYFYYGWWWMFLPAIATTAKGRGTVQLDPPPSHRSATDDAATDLDAHNVRCEENPHLASLLDLQSSAALSIVQFQNKERISEKQVAAKPCGKECQQENRKKDSASDRPEKSRQAEHSTKTLDDDRTTRDLLATIGQQVSDLSAIKTQKKEKPKKKKCEKQKKKKKEKKTMMFCTKPGCSHFLPSPFQGTGHDSQSRSWWDAMVLLSDHGVLLVKGKYKDHVGILVAIQGKEATCLVCFALGQDWKRVGALKTKNLVHASQCDCGRFHVRKFLLALNC